jgi:hypothetical protein
MGKHKKTVELLAEKAKQRMVAGKVNPSPNSEQGKTMDKISEVAKIGKDTLYKIENIKKNIIRS